MLWLCCEITIGKYQFQTVHDVEIKKSMHSYVDTAILKLPTSARLQMKDQKTESQQVAKLFNRGDAITIKLGYNGDLVEEFRGFINRVDFGRPCVVECEGYSWQLRNKVAAKGKSWKNPTVKEVLQYAVEGTDIVLSSEIPTAIATGKIYLFPGQSSIDLLEQLKKEAQLTTYFVDNMLYAGLAYTAQVDKSVVYKLGWNTIKDDSLKYLRPEDAKVQVSVNFKDKHGKDHHKVYGKVGGNVVKLKLGLETDINAVKAKAQAFAEKHIVAGYEGKITAFLIPYAAHGWKAKIEDDVYEERRGDYIIASTVVNFGMNGGRRTCEISKRLDIKSEPL